MFPFAREDWYGSTEAFTEYVRGPLQQELLKSSSYFAVPLQYYPVILLAFVGESLDELLGLYMAGAPSRNLLGHVLSHTVGQSTWIVASLELMAYLSYRWAAPQNLAKPVGGLL